MTRMATVFLDRDGVLNEKIEDGYVRSWGDFRMLSGVEEAIQLLNQAKCRVFIVTNQRGIALGHMTIADLQSVHERMLQRLRLKGAHIDGIYYCPHDRGECSCRKPGIGLFQQIQRDFPSVELGTSVLVGDSASDMRCAHRLGCWKVLIDNRRNNVAEQVASEGIVVDLIAPSLRDAVPGILARMTGWSQTVTHSPR